jgi:hypothetical protein
MSARNAHRTRTIQLTEDSETIASEFKGIVYDQASEADKQLEGIARSKERADKRLAGATAKKNRRREIERKLNERAEKKRLAYEKSREAWRVSKAKLRNLVARESQLYNEVAVLEQRERTLRNYHRLVEETYGEDSFVTRASMLRSVEEFIDTSIPVKYQELSTSNGQILTFRTNEIFLKNGLGGYDRDVSFGKFDIEVIYSINSGVASVGVMCHTVGGRGNRVGDYSHPHIQGSGHPCLGNVQRMLLEHMKNLDVAMVVHLMVDYLTTYNPADPYRHAEYWGVRVAHGSTPRCDCALSVEEPHFRIDCPLVGDPTKDMYTGEVLTEENTSPCGSTYSSCMVNHVHVPESRGFAMNTGVNGTGCQVRAVAPHVSDIKRIIRIRKGLA